MKARTLLGLTVVLAVLVLTAVIQRRSPSRPAAAGGSQAGRMLFPALDINAVAGLELQDGTNTVRLARQAWTCKHLTAMLDCLAAAYARAGNFDEAAAAQAEVMARMGKEKKPPERLKQAQARLELYKSGQPYTDTDAPTKD